jgi:hypothetical protein
MKWIVMKNSPLQCSISNMIIICGYHDSTGFPSEPPDESAVLLSLKMKLIALCIDISSVPVLVSLSVLLLPLFMNNV